MHRTRGRSSGRLRPPAAILNQFRGFVRGARWQLIRGAASVAGSACGARDLLRATMRHTRKRSSAWLNKERESVPASARCLLQRSDRRRYNVCKGYLGLKVRIVGTIVKQADRKGCIPIYPSHPPDARTKIFTGTFRAFTGTFRGREKRAISMAPPQAAAFFTAKPYNRAPSGSQWRGCGAGCHREEEEATRAPSHCNEGTIFLRNTSRCCCR